MECKQLTTKNDRGQQFAMDNCDLIEGEKDWIKSVLGQYRVSYNRGFIPEKDPLVMTHSLPLVKRSIGIKPILLMYNLAILIEIAMATCRHIHPIFFAWY